MPPVPPPYPIDSTSPPPSPPQIINKITTANASNVQEYADLMAKSLIKKINVTKYPEKNHWFNGTTMSDTDCGIIVLLGALFILCLTLYMIVRTLKSILQGQVAVLLHKSVNGTFQDKKCGSCTFPLQWIAGYLAMGAGLGLTILVQSSSITTSSLTPLVGVGVLSLERMYPVVLGANIGTCITGMLAALAADGSKLEVTLQVAFAHLFFNLCGILLWYVIWPLRVLPINAAKFLGDTTARYRWFALSYIFVMFLCVPAIFVGLSMAGVAAIATFTTLVILIMIFVVVVNTMQTRCKAKLPKAMQTWEFLPAPLRTLEPYDRIFCQPCIGAAERSAACPCCTVAAPRRDSDEGYDSSESDGVPVKPVKPVKKEVPADAAAEVPAHPAVEPAVEVAASPHLSPLLAPSGPNASIPSLSLELAVVPSASADELV